MAEDASPFEKFVDPDFTFDVPDDEASYRQALIARYQPPKTSTCAFYGSEATAFNVILAAVFHLMINITNGLQLQSPLS